jgi:hypothetical protein
LERIETLSGERRLTFRRDDEVLTFLPATKTGPKRATRRVRDVSELLKPDETAIP